MGSTAPNRNVSMVPLVGTIAAGVPITAHENIESLVPVPQEMIHNVKTAFALRVKGTSMIDALINDGDLVVMEPTNSANNGDMVAVWLKDRNETTLKKIYYEGARVRLQPANVTMDPIYADADDVEVQGRVLYRLGGSF